MKLDPVGDPYADGLEAGHRIGRYEGCRDAFIDCPWPENSPEYKLWQDGFGDGTEDFIAWQRAE